ncbi:insulinase family protein [Immundisolibacter sp.]|uniref:insulinase family protein n=1 Tax=Immundisolibacter sp. TaxID=1934948 RepID=UPI002617AD1A|nr:insulinase family protein [Immundisolibacter sp.]MDD3650463.1 insulinase family protein [Immundisolibacter sp.]
MTHPAFEPIRSERVSALNLTVEEYRHRVTGARHIHLAAADDNNAFLVAFLTVPQDSTGVAHILEHTVLCGSRHYPVRDPFFLMLRRSLNTFMNAMTASDWTAYPFASQNRKDFFNLLDVYLDAAFFPTLDPLDFAQEGHRLEFAVPDDPRTELTFKGVVYNEMKGAMSAPVSALWQALAREVYPTTTYHYNSGGDPEHIPDLTYEQLKAFHARHYHPSNATFFTYGDIPAAEHQAVMEDRVLRHFERLDIDLRVPPEQRYPAPRAVEDAYAAEPGDTARKTHVVLGWLLGDLTDLDAVLRANLLSRVLLDNSSSPLLHALETTPLGSAPSPLCGLDDSPRELLFAAGVEGSEPEHAEAVEKLVLDVLTEVADKGVPAEQVEAMLHQIELGRREIGGDRYPYGLQLIMNALPQAIHHGDPVQALAVDAALERLRAAAAEPNFVQNEVRRWLLDNPHRVRLTMKPDPTLAERQRAAERERLARIEATLDEAGRRRIVEQALALQARQVQQDDPDILPRVTRQDVAPTLKIPQPVREPVAGLPAAWYDQPTNGLVYQQLVVDLPALADDELNLLPLLAETISEVGAGGRDYTQTQALHAALTGGIGASASVGALATDNQRSRGVFVVSGKALVRNHGALSRLLRETLHTARFDELERLRELVAQIRLADENSVTGNGHALAMAAASAGMTPVARLAHQWSGLAGIKAIKALDDGLDDDTALEALAERLAALRERIAAAPLQFLVVAEDEQQPDIAVRLAEVWHGAGARPAAAQTELPLPPAGGRVAEAWITNTQVNFCARAYPAVAWGHPDAPALSVLGGYLRNGFLHTAIREKGGAYGGGAGFDADSGAFRFYSYRDPRLAETLADFDRALDWLHGADHPPRAVEEAILGVIAAIDRPASPAGEARKAFHASLFGRDADARQAYRRAVLAVTLDDLRRVAAAYLQPPLASTAVITNQATFEQAGDLGLTPIRL